MKSRAGLLSLAALALPLAALAITPNPLTVTQPWARATPPGATVGVVYFDIVNAGPADTLVSIETPVAARAEMHETTMTNGQMRMRPVKEVKVPAQGKVRFATGGLHVMLVGLKQPLVEGQKFPLKLNFKTFGAVNEQVLVKSITATE